MKNKIKYNLKNVHFAEQEESEDGTITFGTPEPIPGSVSLALDAQGEVTKFYADGIVYYKSASNNGYEGDLEIALVPESFRTKIYGEELDTKKVLVEKADAKQKAFALLFEFDGDEKTIRHVLYSCTATRPAIESQTKEDTIEPVTEKMTITASPMADGSVKAKTGDDTDETVYKEWFKAVYIPTESGGPAA